MDPLNVVIIGMSVLSVALFIYAMLEYRRVVRISRDLEKAVAKLKAITDAMTKEGGQ